MTKIIQEEVIINKNVIRAEEHLLARPSLCKFLTSKTEEEKGNFKKHLQQYLNIYLPDCPFEVSSTNRYTIATQEASLTARQPIQKEKTIKYLAGIRSHLQPRKKTRFLPRRKTSASLPARGGSVQVSSWALPAL